MSVLVFYEGVMQTRKHQPILEGYRLLQSLTNSHRTVVLTEDAREKVERQLRTEKVYDGIDDIIDGSVALSPMPLWQRQIELVRSRSHIDFVLTSDPMVVEWCVNHGLLALLFAHPGFSTPLIRPEQGNRKWEDLLAEMEARG